MIPAQILDMTAVLVPFAAGCVGFVAVVFVGLLSSVIARRSRPNVRVDLGRTLPTPRRSRRATVPA
jgi:hypothetical protein